MRLSCRLSGATAQTCLHASYNSSVFRVLAQARPKHTSQHRCPDTIPKQHIFDVAVFSLCCLQHPDLAIPTSMTITSLEVKLAHPTAFRVRGSLMFAAQCVWKIARHSHIKRNSFWMLHFRLGKNSTLPVSILCTNSNLVVYADGR